MMTKKLIGCCGLYCGLCNRYQSKSKSRCVGCRIGEQHDWCSIWNCCVKKHSYFTCAECEALKGCVIFKRRKILTDPEWIPAPKNLRLIRAQEIDQWIDDQMKRQSILENLLDNYNEGRSMSLYCRACARLPIEALKRATINADDYLIKNKVAKSDKRAKAKVLKLILRKIADAQKINIG